MKCPQEEDLIHPDEVVDVPVLEAIAEEAAVALPREQLVLHAEESLGQRLRLLGAAHVLLVGHLLRECSRVVLLTEP